MNTSAKKIAEAERLIREIGGHELRLICRHRAFGFLGRNRGIYCLTCRMRWLRKRYKSRSFFELQGEEPGGWRP